MPVTFSTPLTPKTSEIVQITALKSHSEQSKDKEFYEREMAKAFSEARRIVFVTESLSLFLLINLH